MKWASNVYGKDRVSYIGDHWQGTHALLFALCVSLILIRALILFADRYTLPPCIPDRILA